MMNLLKARKELTGVRMGKLTILRLKHMRNGKGNLLRRKVKTLGIYMRKTLRMKKSINLLAKNMQVLERIGLQVKAIVIQ